MQQVTQIVTFRSKFMNFEVESFSQMLEGFNGICDNYVVQTTEMLQNLQKSLIQAELQQNEQTEILQKQIKLNEDELQTNNQHHSQLTTLHDKYEEQKSLLKQQISELKSDIETYKAQIRDLKQQQQMKQSQVQKTAKRDINPALKHKYNLYETMLKMTFDFLDNGEIQITFWGIKQNDKDKKYKTVIKQDDIGFNVVSPRDIQGLEEFEEESKMTGNFGLLVRRIRRALVQMHNKDDIQGNSRIRH